MKSLKEQLSLKGEMETITATELRARIGECLTQVSLGKSYCVRRKGEVVAFIVSPENANVRHEIQPDGSCSTLDLSPLPKSYPSGSRYGLVRRGNVLAEETRDESGDNGDV